MRIIAGEFRSRVLLGPPNDNTTRPITDRVKQSLFDILTPLLDEHANVYDCFAGTGSMGLESLSRGARHATFMESDRFALALLRRNIAALGVEGRSTTISTDLFRYFADAAPPAESQRASVIFLDPPYRYVRQRPGDLRDLGRGMIEHLAPGGVVVFRHDAQDRLELGGLVAQDQRTYGGMTLEFLIPEARLRGQD